MSIAMVLFLVSGLILLVMIVRLAMPVQDKYISSTAKTHNGSSYERSRTKQYDRYG